MLGDVIVAEPGARLGFAGPRVIAQTIRQELPPGFQTAEFLLEHGFIDQVCPRSELRDRLGRLLAIGARRQPRPTPNRCATSSCGDAGAAAEQRRLGGGPARPAPRPAHHLGLPAA